MRPQYAALRGIFHGQAECYVERALGWCEWGCNGFGEGHGTGCNRAARSVASETTRDGGETVYWIEDGQTGEWRRANSSEVRGIEMHIVEYPECNGTQVRDDGGQTLFSLKQYLWCRDCRVRVYTA